MSKNSWKSNNESDTEFEIKLHSHDSSFVRELSASLADSVNRNVTSFSRCQSEIRQIEKGAYDRRLAEKKYKRCVSRKNGKDVLLIIDSTANSAELMTLRIERLSKQNKVTGTSFSHSFYCFSPTFLC